VRETFKLALCMAILDGNVLPFDVSQVAQALAKCIDAGHFSSSGGSSETPDGRDFLQLLRLGDANIY